VIDTTRGQYTIPYWLVITIGDDNELLIRFLTSPNLSRDTYVAIKAQVVDAIKKLNDRVNQLCLLNSLHDTRTCNVLLVPDRVEEPPTSPSVRLVYTPGCFGCEMKHEMTLKVRVTYHLVLLIDSHPSLDLQPTGCQ